MIELKKGLDKFIGVLAIDAAVCFSCGRSSLCHFAAAAPAPSSRRLSLT